MARTFTPKVITANDLFDGDVIYMTRSGAWTRDHAAAHPATTEAQATTMLAHAHEQANRVVGPYAADVTLNENGVPQPAHFREVFRTRGPSNYFHGKQADMPGGA